MGIGAEPMSRILEAASHGEVVVAELDQNNRILSHFGDIPLYHGALIGPEDFRERSRNRMQIVVTSDVVAIKKTYSIRGRFSNEVLSLDALRHVEGVPRIISVNLKNRILYQSFIPGENLGSLMAERGATVRVQFQVGKAYPGPGLWQEGHPESDQRELLLRALHDVVGDEFLTKLEVLIQRAHQAGVALRDVKHGNVLIHDGAPHLCDFDLSHRFQRNGIRFLVSRDRERDRFNYLFARDLPTTGSLQRDLMSARSAAGGGGLPPAYFGKGYASGLRLVYAGSVKWRMLRKSLPKFSGVRIVELGSGDAVLLMEMLRAGAGAALMFEPDPTKANFAAHVRRFFELTDNRTYDLKVMCGESEELTGNELSSYSVAVALTGTTALDPERVCEAASRLPPRVDRLFVECPANDVASVEYDQGRWKGGLANCGFPRQRLIPIRGQPSVLILASR
jgi:serine/threonine protein kinase